MRALTPRLQKLRATVGGGVGRGRAGRSNWQQDLRQRLRRVSAVLSELPLLSGVLSVLGGLLSGAAWDILAPVSSPLTQILVGKEDKTHWFPKLDFCGLWTVMGSLSEVWWRMLGCWDQGHKRTRGGFRTGNMEVQMDNRHHASCPLPEAQDFRMQQTGQERLTWPGIYRHISFYRQEN